MKASNIIALIVVLIILSLLIIYVVLPCCYIIIKLILKIFKPIVFDIKYKKNKYIPTYKFKNTLSIFDIRNFICGVSGDKSIEKHYELPTSDYIRKFNITSNYAEIFSFSDSRSHNKASCILHSTTHKNDYFKYIVTIQKIKDLVYINTYIFGKSKNCSFHDFQTKLPNVKFSSISDLYKSYSSEKEEELYFYKALNEHLKKVISYIASFK